MTFIMTFWHYDYVYDDIVDYDDIYYVILPFYDLKCMMTLLVGD